MIFYSQLFLFLSKGFHYRCSFLSRITLNSWKQVKATRTFQIENVVFPPVNSPEDMWKQPKIFILENTLQFIPKNSHEEKLKQPEMFILRLFCSRWKCMKNHKSGSSWLPIGIMESTLPCILQSIRTGKRLINTILLL